MLSSLRAGGSIAICVMALMPSRGFANAAMSASDRLPIVTGALTLPRVLELADRYQLSLRAADLRAEAASARIRDANRRPNPRLTATEENFGDSRAPGRGEATLELQQTLELGGDRGARTATAQAEYEIARAEADVLRRERLAEAAERFIAAWTLQARSGRLREGERLTQEAITAASDRFRAGASLLLERSRAESDALSQAVERRRTEAESAVARRLVAALWGASEAAFDSLALPNPDFSGNRGEEDGRVDGHPELARAAANQSLAALRIRAARADRVPDLEVSGGVRRFQETHSTGFLAGIQIPLPLWSGGSGTLAAAHREAEAASADARDAARRLTVAAAGALERVRSTRATYDTLRVSVRPARERLVHELLQAYRAGRMSYLDLIAEQRNLVQTDLALVEAEADLWRARMDLDFLVGGAFLPTGPRKEER